MPPVKEKLQPVVATSATFLAEQKLEVTVERSRHMNLSDPGGRGMEVMEKPSDDRSPEEAASAGNEKPGYTEEGRGGDPKVGRAEREAPPDDDVCPICFDDFTVPCKSVCGHWYCASCILTHWSYSAKPRPCKCPMCSCEIHVLIPQESLLQLHVKEVDKVLREIQRYNLLFVGGIRQAVQRACEVPFLIRRYVQRFFNRAIDPDRMLPISEMRFVVTFLVILYRASPLQSIPTGGLEIQHLYHIGFVLLVVLRLIGILRSYRHTRHARLLRAVQPHQV